jgi:putative intracellular protease/amidase
MKQTTLEIEMLLYPGFTMLDLVGPMTVFEMHSNVHLLWKSLERVNSDTSGVAILPNTTLTECPLRLDVLFVPGGFRTAAAMHNVELIAFLKEGGESASYITSVCSGSMVLGAAGLLDGYKGMTHWAAHELLKDIGAVPVKARIVEDRNRFTVEG